MSIPISADRAGRAEHEGGLPEGLIPYTNIVYIVGTRLASPACSVRIPRGVILLLIFRHPCASISYNDCCQIKRVLLLCQIVSPSVALWPGRRLAAALLPGVPHAGHLAPSNKSEVLPGHGVIRVELQRLELQGLQEDVSVYQSVSSSVSTS